MKIKMERKDTLLLKQQLADSLGESGLEYWKKLGDFLQLKTSKKELDALALTIFTLPQQAKIHNKLITSILYNTSPHLPQPVGEHHEFAGRVSKKQINERAMGHHFKKRFNTKTIMMMSPEERSRISSLIDYKPAENEETFSLNKYPKG